MKRIIIILMVSILILSLQGTAEAAWSNSSITNRQVIHLNQTGSTLIESIPVVLNGTVGLDTATMISGSKLDSDGYCFWVRDSSNNELYWHFENKTSTTYGLNTTNTLIWSNVSIAATNSSIYIYYDNDCGASSHTAYMSETSTYGSEYEQVTHSGEESAAVSLDSTSNNIDGTLTGNSAYASGKVGYGVTYDGTGDYLDHSAESKPTPDMTMFAWVNSDVTTGIRYIVQDFHWSSGPYGWLIAQNATNLRCYISTPVGGTSYDLSGETGDLTSGVWHGVACRRNATGQDIWIDGSYQASMAFASTTIRYTTSHDPHIGCNEAESECFDGEIDTVIVTNDYKSSDWIRRMYELDESYANVGWEETAPADSSPVTTLVTPADSSSDDDGSITFNCSATDDIGISNITLWHNGTGTWHANSTNSSVTGTYDFAEFDVDITIDGEVIWNCITTDNSSQTDWANANFTVTVDTTAPDLWLHHPKNITYNRTNVDAAQGYMYFPLRTSSTGCDSTWYSLNGGTNTSFTINTTVNGTEGQNTLIVYCNDSANNLNQTTQYFSINSSIYTISETEVATGMYTITGGSIGDGNNDGNNEVIFGETSADGQDPDLYRAFWNGTGWNISVAKADIAGQKGWVAEIRFNDSDGDGVDDIMVHTSDDTGGGGFTYAWTMNLTLGYIVDQSNSMDIGPGYFHGLTYGNLTGDNTIKRATILCGGGEFYIYNQSYISEEKTLVFDYADTGTSSIEADLDNDGVLEIIVTHKIWTTSQEIISNVVGADNTLTSQTWIYNETSEGTEDLEVCDVDGDGSDELIATFTYNQDDAETTYVAAYKWDGSEYDRYLVDFRVRSVNGTVHGNYTNYHGSSCSDIDGDGKDEFMVYAQNWTTGTVTTFVYMYHFDTDMTAWRSILSAPSGAGHLSQRVNWQPYGDADNDGDDELVFFRTYGHTEAHMRDGTNYMVVMNLTDNSPDTTPQLTIDLPTNTTQTSVPISVNVTTNFNADSCLFNIDGGTNTTMSNSSMTNWFSETSNVTNSTTNELTVYCNDTGGSEISDSVFFFFTLASSIVTVTAIDEVTLERIPLFFANFVITGLLSGFSTNKSLGDDFVGAGGTVDDIEYFYDGDFDTFSLVTYSPAGLPGINYNLGTIDVRNSNDVCITYQCVGNGCQGGTSELYLKDEDSIWRKLDNITLSSTDKTRSCSNITGYTFPDLAEYNVTYNPKGLGSGAGGTRTVRMYEFSNIYTNDTGQMVINSTDINPGTNRIEVDESNANYFGRFYTLSVITTTNTSLTAYLASITTSVVQDTFIIQDTLGIPQNNVSATILKNIDGSFVEITDDVTDDSGTVSFELIQFNRYRIMIVSGSITQILEFTALGTTRFITLNETLESNFTAPLDGIQINIKPQIISYNSSEVSYNVSFEFTISSIGGELSLFGAVVSCDNVVVNTTNVTGSPSGGSINITTDVVGCDNITFEYYFIKTGYDLWSNTITYYPDLGLGTGLWEALELAKKDLTQPMLNFIAVMVIIFVAAGLAQFSPEGAAIAELIVGGIFTASGWLDWYLYILLTIIVFSILLIKRRLL